MQLIDIGPCQESIAFFHTGHCLTNKIERVEKILGGEKGEEKEGEEGGGGEGGGGAGGGGEEKNEEEE